MADALHFAVGLAFQRGGLVQRVRYRDQVLALVIAVVRALARAVLITLDLGQGVPPQVLGLVGRIDDGVRQAVIAVQVLGHLAEGIDFGEQVALVVVTRSPGAAIRVAGPGHQRGQVVISVSTASLFTTRLMSVRRPSGLSYCRCTRGPPVALMSINVPSGVRVKCRKWSPSVHTKYTCLYGL